MKEYMIAAGRREPTFEPDGFFRAIFQRDSEFAMKEGKKVRRKSCAFCGTEKRPVHGKLPRSWGCPPRAVEKHIAALKTAGRLRRIGPAKGGRWEVAQEDE